MKKCFLMAVACLSITLALPITSFADENQSMSFGWKQDATGWWYQEENGAYPVNSWKELSGKWYYFNQDGYMIVNAWVGNYYLGADGAMLTNTLTPDGYQVGADGAWIRKNTTWSDEKLQMYVGVYDSELNSSIPIYMEIDEISGGRVWGSLRIGTDTLGETFAEFNGNEIIDNKFTVLMEGYILEETDPASEDIGSYLGDCSDLVEIKFNGTHTNVPAISIECIERGVNGNDSYTWRNSLRKTQLTFLALKRWEG